MTDAHQNVDSDFAPWLRGAAASVPLNPPLGVDWGVPCPGIRDLRTREAAARVRPHEAFSCFRQRLKADIQERCSAQENHKRPVECTEDSFVDRPAVVCCRHFSIGPALCHTPVGFPLYIALSMDLIPVSGLVQSGRSGPWSLVLGPWWLFPQVSGPWFLDLTASRSLLT